MNIIKQGSKEPLCPICITRNTQHKNCVCPSCMSIITHLCHKQHVPFKEAQEKYKEYLSSFEV